MRTPVQIGRVIAARGDVGREELGAYIANLAELVNPVSGYLDDQEELELLAAAYGALLVLAKRRRKS